MPIRPAGTTAVTNCDDDGSAGSLRSVVAAAVDGDTIDLSALTCSTITLAQGAIHIDVDNLTLVGPSASELTIDGAQTDYVLYHSGYGTVTVDHLTVSNGYGYYVGGGINSLYGNVTLDHATISNNTAYYQGAGVSAGGQVIANSSTISGNMTTSSPSNYNLGGGLLGATGVTLNNSTLMNNSAYIGAGAYAFNDIVVNNSTISGNQASLVGGGIVTQSNVTVHNSTIARNYAYYGGSGILVGGAYAPDIQSSIVADNTAYAVIYSMDIGAQDPTLTITGSHNLILASDMPLPDDTINIDPLLPEPADHGGPTWTIALDEGSPAIDAGSNPDNLDFDQRGDGFAREAGAAADIGAFEVQGSAPDDTIFKDGFDGSGNPATCSPTQLFQDPSFEQTSAFWDANDDVFSSPFCTSGCGAPAHSGAVYAWMGGSANADTSFVSQEVTFASGQSRWLNWWMASNLVADPTATLTVTIDGTQIQSFGSTAQADANYVAHALQIPALYLDGQAHTVSINFSTAGSQNGTDPVGVLVDDVTLDCSAQPTHATRPAYAGPVPAALRRMH